MNVSKFFVVIVVSLFSCVAAAAEIASMQAGRFAMEFTDDGPVMYGGNFSAPLRPISDFGPWENQVFVNSTTGELVYYKCSFTELGELASCSPRLVDTVITPDPASLPEDVIIGFVRNINLARSSFEMIWHVTESQESVWSDTGLYGVVGPLSSFWTNHSASGIYMKKDTMEQLLMFLGPKTLADTAVGGVMVFLVRGDGNSPVQRGVAVGNTD